MKTSFYGVFLLLVWNPCFVHVSKTCGHVCLQFLILTPSVKWSMATNLNQFLFYGSTT